MKVSYQPVLRVNIAFTRNTPGNIRFLDVVKQFAIEFSLQVSRTRSMEIEALIERTGAQTDTLQGKLCH